jgi:hypothetical protein
MLLQSYRVIVSLTYLEDGRLVEQANLQRSFDFLVGPDTRPADLEDLVYYRIWVLDDAFKDRQEDIPMLFQKCRFYHC